MKKGEREIFSLILGDLLAHLIKTGVHNIAASLNTFRILRKGSGYNHQYKWLPITKF